MTCRTAPNGEVTAGPLSRSIPVFLVVASLILSALFLQGAAAPISAASELTATAAPVATAVPAATRQPLTTATATVASSTASPTTTLASLLSPTSTRTAATTPTRSTPTATPKVVVAAQPTPGMIESQGLRTVRAANGREVAAGQIIVGYRDGVTEAEQQATHQRARGLGIASAAAKRSLGQSTRVVDVSSATSIDEAVRIYASDPRVRFAQPDYVVKASEIPNDTYWGTYQWDMRTINAPTAWDYTHGSSGVLVAILDSGIYTDHPDLAGKVVASNDLRGLSDPIDRFGHGTHVAGIAAAIPNNSQGIAGVGWNTRLLNGKVLGDTGSGSESDVIAGINWATDWGARVVNLSLGTPGYCDTAMQDSIDNAYAHNVVVVAAAGNDGLDEFVTPARCNRVVSVASTDASDARASTSNYGTWVTVAAPGANIMSTWSPIAPQGTGYYYGSLSGTSMATPHVSGLAALLWATEYGSSAQAVVDRIKSTADQTAGTGTLWQGGRINAARAVAPRVSSVSIGASPSSPQAAGTTITLTASPSPSGISAQYLWWIAPTGGSWSVLRDWGGPTFSWDTARLAAGNYSIAVWARATGSAETYEASTAASFTLSAPIVPRVSSVSIGASPSSPQTTGTSITFTASPTPSGISAQYLWWVAPTGGSWTVARDWGSSSSFTWNTTGLAAGSYSIAVWAKATGSAETLEASSAIAFTLSAPATPRVTSVSIGAGPASPQAPGTAITFTASPSPSGISAQYLWWVAPTGGSWTVARDWGGPSFTWDTSSLSAGSYSIAVWAKATGSAETLEASTSIAYVLSTPATPRVTSVSIGASPASPQTAGTSITFTATPSPSGIGAQYLWWVAPTGGSWTVARGWGSSSFTWDTTGLASGNYSVAVWARATGSSETFESSSATSFVLSAPTTPRVSAVSIGASPASPQAAGTAITFTATPSPSGISAQYLWWIAPTGGSWSVARDWGGSSFTWDTTSQAAGNYSIAVWAKATGSAETLEASSSIAYVLSTSATPRVTSVSIGASPSSPQAAGTSITFTATPSPSGVSAQYLWWVAPTGGSWSVARDWGSASFTWDTAGLTAGSYSIAVWARAAGSTDSYQATSGYSYVLSALGGASATTSASTDGKATASGRNTGKKSN